MTDLITPQVNPYLIVADVDAQQITSNLFKNMQIPLKEEEKIRSFLKIRPLPTSDPRRFYRQDGSKLHTIPPPMSQTAKNDERKGNGIRERIYEFTRIYEPQVAQENFFASCALSNVARFMAGENCLLFAYGTSSSGKTFTMQGLEDKPGIIPRAIKTIFDKLGKQINTQRPMVKPREFNAWEPVQNPSAELELTRFLLSELNNQKNSSTRMITSFLKHLVEHSAVNETINEQHNVSFTSFADIYKFEVWVSFVEVYNEQFNDLLSVIVDDKKPARLRFLKSNSGDHYVDGLNHVFVRSAEEALKVYQYGKNSLRTAETRLNKDSSRSHCSFTIHLARIETEKEDVTISNMAFCDLAGSERSNKTNNTGLRLQEAGKINTSLMALKRVITDLRHNQIHKDDNAMQRTIPFRDSKLTTMFKPYFCGAGYTNLIITLNPDPTLFDESQVALQFASLASELATTNEDQKIALMQRLNRMTQMWMQSTQRWSSIAAKLPPPKPSFAGSILSSIDGNRDTLIGSQEPLPCGTFDSQGSVTGSQETEDFAEDDEDEATPCMNTVVKVGNRALSRLSETLNNKSSNLTASDLAALAFQVDHLEKALEEARQRSEEEKMDIEMKLREQFADEIEKLNKDMSRKVQEREKQKNIVQITMEERLRNLQKLKQKEEARLQTHIQQLEAEVLQLKKDLKSTVTEREDLKRRLESANTTLESTLNRTQQETTQIECLGQELKDAQAMSSEAQRQLEAKEQELDSLRNNYAKLEAKLSERENKIHKLENEREENENFECANIQLTDQVTALEESLAKASQENELLKSQIKDLENVKSNSVSEKDSIIKRQATALADKDIAITSLKAAIETNSKRSTEKDALLASKDSLINELSEKIRRLIEMKNDVDSKGDDSIEDCLVSVFKPKGKATIDLRPNQDGLTGKKKRSAVKRKAPVPSRDTSTSESTSRRGRGRPKLNETSDTKEGGDDQDQEEDDSEDPDSSTASHLQEVKAKLFSMKKKKLGSDPSVSLSPMNDTIIDDGNRRGGAGVGTGRKLRPRRTTSRKVK